MGFNPQNTARPFTRDWVASLAEGQNGVYGIFRSDQMIYVGRGDIRQRLLAHLNGDNPAILSYKPTHWIDEVHSEPYASIREKELISEFNPPANKRIG